MKKLLLAFVAVVGVSLSAMAQDFIVLKDAIEVQAKVESIGLQEVVYRKWDNLEGPTYTLPKSEILFIKYANGQKDMFSVQQTIVPTRKNNTTETAYQENLDKKFEGYASVGAISNFSGFSVDLSLGARISKYFYVGGGVGWMNEFSFSSTTLSMYYPSGETLSIPLTISNWSNRVNITADLKAYIPTKCGLYPRFDLSFGPSIAGSYYKYYIYNIPDGYSLKSSIDKKYVAGVGFCVAVGVGFDYRKLSFGVGCMAHAVFGDELKRRGYLRYVRIGVRFGKK